MRPLPDIKVSLDPVPLSGGLDLVTPVSLSKPGSLSACSNYESLAGGGYERVGGYERFDGRAQPSQALYTLLATTGSFATVALGAIVTGASSAATGTVIAATTGYLAVSKQTGSFTLGESLLVAAVSVGTYNDANYPTSALLDNQLLALAAALYRPDIGAVPGSGKIRGLEILNDVVYAWRNNAGGTAMAIYKSTATGWQAISLPVELGFTTGSVFPFEGTTITKGTVSATVARVVLESGSWTGGTAAGRLIVTNVTGGPFTAGALTAGGTLTLAATLTGSAVQAQITLSPGGRVVCDTANFGGGKRLYGCDGVNREFEFDGTTLVPLKTGLSIPSSFVKAHRNHLIYGVLGSLQTSGIGAPYSFSPLTGAAELATGDTITGLTSVGGSETAAALMVHCKNAVWMLYGNSSADWKMVQLSEVRGANAYSVQDIGFPLGHDAPGFVLFQPTLAYGNFVSEVASVLVEPLVRNKTPLCSVFVRSTSRYRCFFSDGGIVSITMVGGRLAFTALSLAHTISVATSGEIANQTRTFYGGDNGYVYEADVGRSFDGEAINAVAILKPLQQRNPVAEKMYRGAYIETTSGGPFTLYTSATFDSDDSTVESVQQQAFDLVTRGVAWDLSLWDSGVWDARQTERRRIDLIGPGFNLAPQFATSSAQELPHQIKSLTLLFNPRKLTRS